MFLKHYWTMCWKDSVYTMSVWCLTEKRQRYDNGEDPLDPEEQHQQGNPFFHQGFNPFGGGGGGGGYSFKFHFNWPPKRPRCYFMLDIVNYTLAICIFSILMVAIETWGKELNCMQGKKLTHLVIRWTEKVLWEGESFLQLYFTTRSINEIRSDRLIQ